jgi:hypothetical protein
MLATYEKVAEKGYKDEKMFQKLGDSYFFIADLIKAVVFRSFEMMNLKSQSITTGIPNHKSCRKLC